MPIFDIYSRRKRKRDDTEPDVYQYEVIPKIIRGQIVHIWHDAIGLSQRESGQYEYNNEAAWQFIAGILRRERGVSTLSGELDAKNDCLHILLNQHNIDEWLDIVEISFRYIERSASQMSEWKRSEHGIKQTVTDAIYELNYRLREAGLGFQFADGKIIRIDSQFIHSEVVQPALQLLSDKRFKGAQEEFLAAHTHYRAGEYKDAVVDALNAFESTLKAICDAKSWQYSKGARASDLIKVVRTGGLLPTYLDNSFDQLIATLQSGLPKVRGESGAHGQGATPKETPDYIAAYALHLAAANIVLLVEALNAGE